MTNGQDVIEPGELVGKTLEFTPSINLHTITIYTASGKSYIYQEKFIFEVLSYSDPGFRCKLDNGEEFTVDASLMDLALSSNNFTVLGYDDDGDHEGMVYNPIDREWKWL